MTLPHCRLFLVAPSTGDIDVLAACLASALAAGDAASILLPANEEVLRKLMPIAHSHDLAVLIDGDVDMAGARAVDGVQISTGLQTYNEARTSLDSNRIIGVQCHADRHAAMELGEAGADYIVLDQDTRMPEGDRLIEWWAAVMQVPCVAANAAEPAEIAELAKAGIDFIRPLDDMWSSPGKAAQVITAANKTIAEAAQ